MRSGERPSSEDLQSYLKQVDLWQLRNQVLAQAGFGECNEASHMTLLRAFAKHASINGFAVDVRNARLSHKAFLKAIL